MNNEVREYVKSLLSDKKGHGIDHIDRVRRLALSFANQLDADKQIVELAAYLHDVDDYKLFGEHNAKELTNAKYILNKIGVTESTKTNVLNIINTMGYSRCLDGIRPNTTEGMIVSDADMCDAIGSIGIVRAVIFGEGLNRNFFNKSIKPQDAKSSNIYKQIKSKHGIQHFFDKLLLVPNMMLTEPGFKEAKKRQNIQIEFLRELFRENNSELWSNYLEEFIFKHKLVRG